MEQKVDKLTQALLDIVSGNTLYSGSYRDVFQAITKAGADALNAPRVSIWMYDEDRALIHCLDLYENGTHSEGAELLRADFPAYFSALKKDGVIRADDAHSNVATKEFSETYLKPLGICSMLDAPIRFDENSLVATFE